MNSLENSNNVGNIKIKQEKITPPSTPTPEQDNVKKCTSENESLSIFRKILNDEPIETKRLIEPIKSSNEILAELFQVFNAPPPEVDSVEPKELKESKHSKKSKKSKKKHKKEKKSDRKSTKKHKKHKKSEKNEKSAAKCDGGSSSSTSSEFDNTVQEVSEKKARSAIKRKINVKETEVVPEKQRRDSATRELPPTSTNAENKDITKNVKNLQGIITKTELSGSNKIKIKDLSNSDVYRETIKQVEEQAKQKEQKKEKERHRERRKHRSKKSYKRSEEEMTNKSEGDESAFSISDEESYLGYEQTSMHSSHRDHRNNFYTDDFERHSSDRDREQSHRAHGNNGRHYDRYNDRDCVKNDDRTSSSRSRLHGSRHEHNHDADRRRSSSRSERRGSSRGAETVDRIDKKRLLEIARKNAITMLANGTLPGAQKLAPAEKDKFMANIRFGGKSVDELTEFCKKLSKEEGSGYLSNVSDDSEHDADGNEKPFNHPFVLKDRGPIVMNIKNSVPIPPKTSEQTKAILMQFPVSSGQHHRQNEGEWIPVEPSKPSSNLSAKKDMEQAPAFVFTPAMAGETSATSTALAIIPPSNLALQTPHMEPEPLSVPPPPQPTQSIFPSVDTSKSLDVATIITQRLNAMRKLQDNPLDSEAIKLMYNTQKDMSAWANSKFVPGQFTGSTGANVLSAKELQSGFQAWAKRDQLIATTPVSGGMGMHLLQKMGWKPGEGLGKEKNGSLQPLLLEVKLDKKGLVANEENPQAKIKDAKPKKNSINSVRQNMENKHPVSLLGEICAKRKCGAPMYEVVDESGPFHNRQFLFKVLVNDVVYQPEVASHNKKEAKAVAARYALFQMGILKSPLPSANEEPM